MAYITNKDKAVESFNNLISGIREESIKGKSLSHASTQKIEDWLILNFDGITGAKCLRKLSLIAHPDKFKSDNPASGFDKENHDFIKQLPDYVEDQGFLFKKINSVREIMLSDMDAVIALRTTVERRVHEQKEAEKQAEEKAAAQAMMAKGHIPPKSFAQCCLASSGILSKSNLKDRLLIEHEALKPKYEDIKPDRLFSRVKFYVKTGIDAFKRNYNKDKPVGLIPKMKHFIKQIKHINQPKHVREQAFVDQYYTNRVKAVTDSVLPNLIDDIHQIKSNSSIGDAIKFRAVRGLLLEVIHQYPLNLTLCKNLENILEDFRIQEHLFCYAQKQSVPPDSECQNALQLTFEQAKIKVISFDSSVSRENKDPVEYLRLQYHPTENTDKKAEANKCVKAAFNLYQSKYGISPSKGEALELIKQAGVSDDPEIKAEIRNIISPSA